MLHYKLNQEFKRERPARDALRWFAVWGAAIHRIGDTQRFEMLVPIRKPERRAALRRMLENNAVGGEFVLVDVTGFDRNGPIYHEVSEDEADEIIKTPEFKRSVTRERPEADEHQWIEVNG